MTQKFSLTGYNLLSQWFCFSPGVYLGIWDSIRSFDAEHNSFKARCCERVNFGFTPIKEVCDACRVEQFHFGLDISSLLLLQRCSSFQNVPHASPRCLFRSFELHVTLNRYSKSGTCLVDSPYTFRGGC